LRVHQAVINKKAQSLRTELKRFCNFTIRSCETRVLLAREGLSFNSHQGWGSDFGIKSDYSCGTVLDSRQLPPNLLHIIGQLDSIYKERMFITPIILYPKTKNKKI